MTRAIRRPAILAAIFLMLAGAAADATALRVDAGVVEIRRAALGRTGPFLLAEIAFPPQPSRRRHIGAEPDESEAGALLRRLIAAGAAGNFGDLYDNRDRGHSALRSRDHPMLTFVSYDEAARAEGLDHGLNHRLIFDGIVFGNASLAIGDKALWRSLPRLAMTQAGAPDRLHRLYRSNHLYVYPEHRDYDPERGDLYPAALPQLLVSDGSSRSDLPILRAIAAALAAMRPDAKQFLKERGLVAPTLQMLLRRALPGVEGDAAYLSPAAHPTAMRGEDIDLIRLIEAANALRPETAPPAVSLRMLAEPTPIPGIGIFGEGLDERLFDTPDSIARVARGVARDRVYRLTAEDTVDPNGRPLRFEWRVLRGEGVRIVPLDPDGRSVEIFAPWIERRFPTPQDERVVTHRIEVAAFAHNGATYSAPAFFTVAYPHTQRRRYAPDGRPLVVDFEPSETKPHYRDHVVFPIVNWRDAYDYDESGRLLGWTRTMRNGEVRRYAHDGRRVINTDALDRPSVSQDVRYEVRRASTGRYGVVEIPLETFYAYRYESAADRIGASVRQDDPRD